MSDETKIDSEQQIDGQEPAEIISQIPPEEIAVEEEFLATKEAKAQRERKIVIASIMAILGNAVLVAAKLVVGLMANSIAIILDAVNNATDALSSIITIAGTKLAGRRPTRKHPFGYGRIEYLTSVIIAIIILVAGFLSLRESIDKILHPAETDYTFITVAIIIFAILMKIVIGVYLKRRGTSLNSQALIASGVDSDYDAVLSAGTLVVAAAQMLFHINIDGAIGLIISLFVLKAGLEVLADALGPIIGEREDDDTDRQIRDYVKSYPQVLGAYDLILDNFGPNEVIGSIHIEVDDDLTAREIAELTRSITLGLHKKFGIIMTVGIYASNTTGAYAPMYADLKQRIADEPKVLQVHGFYVDEATKTVYFDLVVDFKADEGALLRAITQDMKTMYPGYTFNVVIDTDFEGIAS